VIKFEDIFCQMCDLCKPSLRNGYDGRITIKDMLHPDRIKLTGVFFSCMWSVHKLHAFDGRDPILVKQELNSGAISQWDRYAAVEYARLANEEEENNASASQAQQGMSDATTASIIGAAGFGNGGGAGGVLGSFGSSTDFGSTFGGPGSSRELHNGDDNGGFGGLGGHMGHHGGDGGDDFESILENQRL
jgi:hypothetical protein